MKPTLTITIAAYNEAENIGVLLTELLRQKIDTADLVEIVVVSDASTDETDAIVRSFAGEKVKLIRSETRGGAIRAKNMLLRHATVDIMVMLDADILPENEFFVEELIRPIINDSSVGLTSAALLPSNPKTFTEKVLVWNHELKQKLFLSIGSGNNLYTCFGPAQAFSKKLYATIQYPDNTPYDAMSYMFCMGNKMHFVSVKYPRAIFRCPTNLRDHIKQSSRFAAGKEAVIDIFGDEARKAYAIPPGLILREMVKEFFTHPIFSINFILILLYVRLHKTDKFTSLWEMAESSKKIRASMGDTHFLQKIITGKIPCYFISPHLDDAALSAGGLITHLSKHTQVEVISVFTAASTPPYTLSVLRFLYRCGYTDTNQLLIDRKEEDRKAYSRIGITPHHLGYIDASWRKITSPSKFRQLLSRILPEFLHLYPIHQLHIARGAISSHDTDLMRSLGEELRALIANEKQFVIFCPLALKSHIDHVIVRDVCLKNFENVILWKDFPYNMKNVLGSKDDNPLATEVFRFEEEPEMKLGMIKEYTSQTKMMFPDGNIPLVPEVYYSPRKETPKKSSWLSKITIKKDTAIIIAIVMLGLVMYGLTLRGAPGNPTEDQFKNNLDQPTNAFELSPERGRYTQVANMAENGVYNLSKTWADIAYPDVGVSSDGKLDSYFAPGVSYFTLPFYLFGAQYGLGQVATFSAESLISIVTLVFIYLIGLRIFALPRWAALFAVLVYAFGSTSWSYAITLYQNAFTACFIVTAFYAAWRFSQSDARYRFLYAAYVWLAYALAIFVDYPNAVLMLPVMIYLAVSTFSFKKIREGIAISIQWSAIAAFVVFAFVTSLHFWHNATYYGGWSHLAGELKGYKVVTATSTPAIAKASSTTTSATATSTVPIKDKTAVGFFHEKSIPNSFYVLLFSDERGLFFFSPIFIFSLLGIMYVLRRKKTYRTIYIVPIALIATNIFLYCAWGDPWGGSAYGPRYLIPAMPWLALFVGIALSYGRFLGPKKIAAFALFLFSSAIALLGALTSNAIPKKSEAILLPIKTYNYLKDIPLLQDNISGSFVYKTYMYIHLTLMEYFLIIYVVIAVIAAIVLLLSYIRRHE